MARPSLLAALASLAALLGCPTAETTLADVQIAENPANVLSCFVRWTTDEPASSRVEFGEDGFQFFVGDDILVTEHEVFVFGMHAEGAYDLRALSTTADGQTLVSEPQTFGTGTLPFPVATTGVTDLDPARLQPGWTLTNFAINLTVSRVVAVMLDQDARVVWYYDLGDEEGRADVEVSLLGDGDLAQRHVLIGGAVPPLGHPVEVDLAGNVLWEGPEQAEGVVLAGEGMHHTFQQLPGGDFVTLYFDFADGHILDRIEQIDRDLQLTWSWSTADHEDVLGEDYVGGNYVIVDEDDGVAYFNGRIVHRLFKIDRATGDVIWTLGDGGDFEPIPDEPETWFLGTHAPSLLPDGHLLIYDNGAPGERDYSRVVEYELDEANMTAELVWEYPGQLADDEWFNNVWGDVDRLANGNTLITAGSMLGNDSQSRIFEVTPEGDKVWQVLLSGETEGELGGSYMSQRIPVLVGEL